MLPHLLALVVLSGCAEQQIRVAVGAGGGLWLPIEHVALRALIQGGVPSLEQLS